VLERIFGPGLRVVSRIAFLGQSRCGTLFLDDQEPFVRGDYAFDAAIFMGWKDDEMSRHRADRLILGAGCVDDLATGHVVAFAEEVETV
jgi:hypothetical protein